MSDFSTLYAGLTPEQQLYLQQQSARLMMIRSMNQSSSGSNPSLLSSQSASTTVPGLPAANTHDAQVFKVPMVEASPPKVPPTGYYLRRQGDAPSVHAPQPPSLVTTVPVDSLRGSISGQPAMESHMRMQHAQPQSSVQSAAELKLQIQQLQRQYHAQQLPHQQHHQDQQTQQYAQQQQSLQCIQHDAQQRNDYNVALLQQKTQQQQQQHQTNTPILLNSRTAPAAVTLPHLEPPNLLALFEKPDPSLTFSTFIVFWRQTALTRREIISKLPSRQFQSSTTAQQPSVSRLEPGNKLESSLSAVSLSSSNDLALPNVLDQLSPQRDQALVSNAAYFKEYVSSTGSEEDIVMLWLQDVTGLLISRGAAAPTPGGLNASDLLQSSLRSGVVLCQAANKILPNSVPKISMQDKPFNQRENISAFINFLRRVGVAEKDLFGTEDLFTGKNTRQVVSALLALGRALYKVPNYSGPSPSRPETLRRRSTFEVRQDGLWGKAGGQFGQVRPRS